MKECVDICFYLVNEVDISWTIYACIYLCYNERRMLMKTCSSNSKLNISDGLVNLLLSKLDF